MPRSPTASARRTERTVLLLGIAVWLAVIGVVSLRLLLERRVTHSVYHAFADAARRWQDGADLYGRAPDVFRYSPAVAALLVPFSWLPDRLGEITWRMLNLGVFLAGLLTWLRVCVPALSRTQRYGMLLLVVPMSLASVNNGQANPMLIGLMLAALAAFGRERWTEAAAWVTLATLFKIYPLALGLLLVVLRPKHFAPRLALGLAVGLAGPFLAQRASYVAEQYDKWGEYLAGDKRLDYPVRLGNRDLWQLLRLFSLPIDQPTYHVFQIAGGAAIAVGCVWATRRGWSSRRLLGMVAVLGISWMLLFGPATESCTYILMAPIVGWALLDAAGRGEPPWSRRLLVASAALFLVAELGNLFPVAPIVHGLGPQAMATLLLAIRFGTGGRPNPVPVLPAVARQLHRAA